jgi:multidrug efflux pump subunit AcrA (membrane-fusion protein)
MNMREHPTESTIRSWLLGAVLPTLIVAIGVAIFMAMGKSQPKQIEQDDSPRAKLMRRPIVEVSNGLDFPRGNKLDLDVSGIVVPYRQVSLAAEVAGRVVFKSENCRIGRVVEKDELLFKLDAADYNMEVERLTALRESEYAQQKELNQDVANAKRMLELADQEVELQEKELKRLEQLPSGFASATELDQARRTLLASSNQQLNIQNQLEMFDTRRTRILLAERLAATQLAMANVNLARTEIRSPIAGVIVSEMAEQASYVQKGANLCVIDDTSRVEVSCDLRSDQLLLILDQIETEGTEIRDLASGSYELPATPVTIDFRVAGRDENVYQWEGFLSRYEGIGLDSKSRTVPVRVTVEEPRKAKLNGKPIGNQTLGGLPALVQGMFIDCHFHTVPKRPLMLVPKQALRPGNQIWVVNQDAEQIASDNSSESESSKAAWFGGKAEVFDEVRPLRTVRNPSPDGPEYWVIEARPEFSSQALYVVSPVAGLLGDGSDLVRFQNP